MHYDFGLVDQWVSPVLQNHVYGLIYRLPFTNHARGKIFQGTVRIFLIAMIKPIFNPSITGAESGNW